MFQPIWDSLVPDQEGVSTAELGDFVPTMVMCPSEAEDWMLQGISRHPLHNIKYLSVDLTQHALSV